MEVDRCSAVYKAIKIGKLDPEVLAKFERLMRADSKWRAKVAAWRKRWDELVGGLSEGSLAWVRKRARVDEGRLENTAKIRALVVKAKRFEKRNEDDITRWKKHLARLTSIPVSDLIAPIAKEDGKYKSNLTTYTLSHAELQALALRHFFRKRESAAAAAAATTTTCGTPVSAANADAAAGASDTGGLSKRQTTRTRRSCHANAT